MIEKIFTILEELAEGYTPPGSEVKAVVHQWLHAISNNNKLFGENRGISKGKILDILIKEKCIGVRSDLKKITINMAHIKPLENKMFTFIDLFAGIGGMRLAFQAAGGHCVFSSEYDKYAQITYNKNHGEWPFGDITQIDENDIPDHDVLIAGFPCQPFSKAGVSARSSLQLPHGFNCETQGTLFFDIERIVALKKPKMIFLENVQNLIRHDGGRTFGIIKETIEEKLGYSFNPKVINAVGKVPQNRKRCYMVCFRNKADFSFPEHDEIPIPLSSILENKVDENYTISDRLWQGHINRTERNIKRGTGFTAHPADISKPSNTLVARYGKDGKECLIPQKGKNPRKLTERECARLQGFPDNFLIPVSKSQAYRQFGNSVAVPLIELIARAAVKEIL